jgi:uncharacterized protein (TIGR02270 family)
VGFDSVNDGWAHSKDEPAAASRIVPVVVQQHVEDAAILHATRTAFTRAPHVKLSHLRRFDDRLAAHLDGLAVAGKQAMPLCEAALEMPNAGAMFVAAVRALEAGEQDTLLRLIVLAQSVPECRKGLASAFGWLEREHLRGVVTNFLNSPIPEHRLLGLTASSLHRVDPGLIRARQLEDPDAAVRARAFRAAGELGKRELVSTLGAAIGDGDGSCQFWAGWAAVLVGDRLEALEYLKAIGSTDDLHQQHAMQLALQTLPVAEAHDLLQRIARDPAKVRMLLQGSGLVGDPAYVPWLIGQMTDDKLARLAGEAFTLITGVDLADLDLERNAPEDLETGPNDDPEDPNVDMDADEDLPWPDQKLVQAWWTRHGARFAQGSRHLVGAPVSRDHCVDVLKSGYQRQRIAAAYHLCLLNPGTPLFEWRAPAWRQQRELAQLA